MTFGTGGSARMFVYWDNWFAGIWSFTTPNLAISPQQSIGTPVASFGSGISEHRLWANYHHAWHSSSSSQKPLGTPAAAPTLGRNFGTPVFGQTTTSLAFLLLPHKTLLVHLLLLQLWVMDFWAPFGQTSINGLLLPTL
jgi:hypothetical protein